MTEVIAVGYEPSRRAELVALMATVWGDPEAGEHIEWWFDESPVATGVILLAEVDGQLAGTLGMSYVPMQIGGRREIVAMPVRGVSLEQFRGLGIFSKLELANEAASVEKGARIALTIPNPLSHSIFVRLGWQELRTQRVWVRPLRPRPAPARPARPGPRRYGSLAVEPVTRFDESTEAAWRRAAPLHGDHVIGDAAYLNWRYVDTPHDYRCFQAGEEGYAVVRRMLERGLETGMICTLVASTGRAARALLLRCAEEMRGVQILAALRPPVHTRAWLAAGFVPSPRTMTTLGKPLVEGEPLPADPVYQFGDHDFT
jgi:hypothetical protein